MPLCHCHCLKKRTSCRNPISTGGSATTVPQPNEQPFSISHLPTDLLFGVLRTLLRTAYPASPAKLQHCHTPCREMSHRVWRVPARGNWWPLGQKTEPFLAHSASEHDQGMRRSAWATIMLVTLQALCCKQLHLALDSCHDGKPQFPATSAWTPQQGIPQTPKTA